MTNVKKVNLILLMIVSLAFILHMLSIFHSSIKSWDQKNEETRNFLELCKKDCHPHRPDLIKLGEEELGWKNEDELWMCYCDQRFQVPLMNDR